LSIGAAPGSQSLSPPALILDACTLINLHACRRMESIVGSIPGQVKIATQVYDECRLDPFDPDDEIVERTDLARLIERGALTVVTFLTNAELNSFAAFAIALDDGEAATLALAVHRGWTVVTDDRAAIRELAGQAPLLSTLDLVKTWADTVNIARDVLAATLADLRVRGRYVPNKSHLLWSWWNQHLTTIP
jgi:predicted nucleic acid-binding protein